LEKRQDRFEKKLDSMEEDLKVTRRSLLIIENKHIPMIEIAMEGLSAAIEKNKAQDTKIEKLETITEKHDSKRQIVTT